MFCVRLPSLPAMAFSNSSRSALSLATWLPMAGSSFVGLLVVGMEAAAISSQALRLIDKAGFSSLITLF